MAEEFSTSIGIAHNRLKATFFLSFRLWFQTNPNKILDQKKARATSLTTITFLLSLSPDQEIGNINQSNNSFSNFYFYYTLAVAMVLLWLHFNYYSQGYSQLTLLTEILTLLQNFNISYKNIDITHRNNDSNFIFTVGIIFALLTEEINQVINIYWLFYLYLVTPLIFLPCPNQTSRNLSCFLKFDISMAQVKTKKSLLHRNIGIII
jgi:hypothetical protein